MGKLSPIGKSYGVIFLLNIHHNKNTYNKIVSTIGKLEIENDANDRSEKNLITASS